MAPRKLTRYERKLLRRIIQAGPRGLLIWLDWGSRCTALCADGLIHRDFNHYVTVTQRGLDALGRGIRKTKYDIKCLHCHRLARLFVDVRGRIDPVCRKCNDQVVVSFGRLPFDEGYSLWMIQEIHSA